MSGGSGEARAVIGLEHRHRAIGIDFAEGITQLLGLAQIDLDGLDLVGQPLFGDEHPHLPRAWCCGAIVEFHGAVSPVFVRIDVCAFVPLNYRTGKEQDIGEI
jgi:hypothetical protein